MKIKTLSFSLLILVIIAVVGYWLSERDTGNHETGNIVGNKLIQPESLAKITKIVLQDIAGDKTVLFQKNENGVWILPDYHRLPVEFSKLEDFISSLLNANILRFVTNNKERMERLEFTKHHIVIKANEDTVWSMETGKSGQSGGLFVRFNEGEEAYLSDLTAYFDSNVDNWPEKRMLTFQPTDVAACFLEFPNGESSIKIIRESPESEFTAEGLNENEKLNEEEITRFINTITSARYTNVHELNDPDVMAARDNSRSIDFELFSGKKYNLLIGRRSAEVINAVESNSSDSNDNGLEDEEEPETSEPGPVFIFIENSDPKDQLNEIMQRISFSYSNYVYNQVPESLEKLIESVTPSP